MMSEYDKSNVTNIIIGEGDWFGAHLIRYLSKIQSDGERSAWATEFPEHVEAVRGHYFSGLGRLVELAAKADPVNRAKIARVLRFLAANIDPQEQA